MTLFDTVSYKLWWTVCFCIIWNYAIWLYLTIIMVPLHESFCWVVPSCCAPFWSYLPKLHTSFALMSLMGHRAIEIFMCTSMMQCNAMYTITESASRLHKKAGQQLADWLTLSSSRTDYVTKKLQDGKCAAWTHHTCRTRWPVHRICNNIIRVHATLNLLYCSLS